MKRALSLLLCFASLHVFAEYQRGQTVANLCWSAILPQSNQFDLTTYCLDDAKNTVRVLLFNAGWCGPCQAEFAELTSRLRERHEFAGKPVTFISLSAQGMAHGSRADVNFLRQWQKRFRIPFTVASSKSWGEEFNPNPGVPNLAVIDQNGVLRYTGVGSNIPGLFSVIHSLLKTN